LLSRENVDLAVRIYSFELDKVASLDGADLDALTARHKLRPDLLNRGGMAKVRVRPFSSGQTAMGFAAASSDRHHTIAE